MALLEVDGITVEFVGLKALADVSFHLDAGQVKAVIGPNGAGKSTLFNAITGYVRPTSGTVRFEGRNIIGRPPATISASGMRRTFQNGGVFAEMTVLENVLTGLNQRIGSNALGLLLGLPGANRIERSATLQALQLLETMGLADYADKRAADLSSGQQRLVEISRALAAKTSLLLLDEPAVGLSVAERSNLVATLRSLAAEGMAVLLVEHSIDLVMAVSDEIVVLNYGEVIAQGVPAAIRTHPAVLEAYLGHG